MAEFTVRVRGLYGPTIVGPMKARSKKEAVAKAKASYHRTIRGIQGTVLDAEIVPDDYEEPDASNGR